ncbi:MAG TPA: hypothetical protein VGZ00_01760 [Candidatus Baltobacteraceae bacterium]|nr:hypothetical protein [Candidatus Baltobacteraceae bacterium]
MLKEDTTTFKGSFELNAEAFQRDIDGYEGANPLSEVDGREVAITERFQMAVHNLHALIVLRDNRIDETHDEAYYDYLQGIADRVRISDTSFSLTKGLLAAGVLCLRGVDPELIIRPMSIFKAPFESVDVIAKRGIRSDNAPQMFAVLSMYELEDKNAARSFCAGQLKEGFRREFASMTIDEKAKVIRKQAENTQFLLTHPEEIGAKGNRSPADQLALSNFIFREVEQNIRNPEGREARQFLLGVMKNPGKETPYLVVSAARILAALPELRRDAFDLLGSYTTDGDPLTVLASEAKETALNAATKTREPHGRFLS